MTDHPLSNQVHLAERFYRSVNVELDYARAGSLDGYVVSPLARDVTARITAALAEPNGGRAWSIIGPYGSGKSSFVSFLASLLCRGPAHKSAFLRLADYPQEFRRVAAQVDKIGRLSPVLVTGERIPLAHALLNGLHRTAEQFWEGRRGVTPPIVAELAEARAAAAAGQLVTDERCVELALALADRIKRSQASDKHDGLLIVIDELGKLLEWAALHPDRADVYLLQKLAEAAARSRATVAVVTVLHQDIAAYAARLPRAVRDEWTKIAGRYEPIPYLESPHHIVRLLAGALRIEAGALRLPAFADAQRAGEELRTSLGLLYSQVPLESCFPLHPLTAVCLGPLFRSALGQNERSLFAFLNSREPLGLQDWLQRTDGALLYRLPDLYDYLLHNTNVRLTGARAWTTAEHVLSRLPADAEHLDVELVKAITLLGLVEAAVEVRADEATLALAIGRSDAEVQASIRRLKRVSAIVYRKFKRSWAVWDGSDVDVDAVVQKHRADVQARGGMAEQVERALQPTPIVASRHYIQTGTFRTFRVRYLRSVATARRIELDDGDGMLAIILPDQAESHSDLVHELETVPVQLPTEPPRVFVLPSSAERLHDLALEFLAVHEALRLTSELENDPIARRILIERRVAARDALQAAHDEACAGSSEQPARWWFNGTWLPVNARPSASASEVFDLAYAAAPPIANELVNRAQPSSAAASARRELMQRMLSRAGERRLGIEGHPPELSLYRSILEAMGLHREAEGTWSLVDPPENSRLHVLWCEIGRVVRESGGKRITFETLTKALARPPFGVRGGVAPILLWAWLLVHLDDVFLYEDNSFVPRPGEALVERLLRQPQDIELQSAMFSGRLQQLVEAIHRHAFSHLDLDKGRAPLRIVRQLVVFVKRLSVYAQRTNHVSERAKRVRTAILSARDTIKLISVDLPEAIGANLDAEEFDAFGTQLASALVELDAADAELLNKIESVLRQLFGIEGDQREFLAELSARATKLAGIKQLPLLTRQFVDQTSALDPDVPESRTIWLQAVGSTIVGRQPQTWTDADLDRFRLKAEERVRGFQAAERLAFQMRQLNGKGHLPLIRLDFIDSEGNQSGQFGMLETSGPEMEALITEVTTQVERLRNHAREQNIPDHGVAYAILHAMMAKLTGTAVQGVEEDR